MLKILVVDDDNNIRKLIGEYLKKYNYDAVLAKDGKEALDLIDIHHFDMIITDIMMPYIDGYELVSDIRIINNNIPIIIITAKEAFEDKKIAFNYGADDFITKPINLEEMILRISALFRRSKISIEKKIVLGSFSINQDNRDILINNKKIDLPKKEFELLFKLLSYPKKIFTRRQLMDEIWGMESLADERTVDVHIKRIREKFENCKEFDIITVRGLGYKSEIK